MKLTVINLNCNFLIINTNKKNDVLDSLNGLNVNNLRIMKNYGFETGLLLLAKLKICVWFQVDRFKSEFTNLSDFTIETVPQQSGSLLWFVTIILT